MAHNLEQQRAFAVALVRNGGNITAAAIEAEYSQKSARQIGQNLLDKPHVQKMVRDEQGRVLGRLAGKALCVLEGILDDPTAPAGARVDASKTILDRAGWPAIPANMINRALEDMDPNDMTADELREFIRRGKLQLADLERAAAEESARVRPAIEHGGHAEH